MSDQFMRRVSGVYNAKEFIILGIAVLLWAYIAGVYWEAWYIYAKSNFSTYRWGAVRLWPVLVGGVFSLWVAIIFRNRFQRSFLTLTICSIPIIFVAAIFPLIGSEIALRSANYLPFASTYRILVVALLYLLEIPTACAVVAYATSGGWGTSRTEQVSGVLSIGLTALLVVKIVALVYLPGVTVRF